MGITLLCFLSQLFLFQMTDPWLCVLQQWLSPLYLVHNPGTQPGKKKQKWHYAYFQITPFYDRSKIISNQVFLQCIERVFKIRHKECENPLMCCIVTFTFTLAFANKIIKEKKQTTSTVIMSALIWLQPLQWQSSLIISNIFIHVTYPQ